MDLAKFRRRFELLPENDALTAACARAPGFVVARGHACLTRRRAGLVKEELLAALVLTAATRSDGARLIDVVRRETAPLLRHATLANDTLESTLRAQLSCDDDAAAALRHALLADAAHGPIAIDWQGSVWLRGIVVWANDRRVLRVLVAAG